MSDTSEQLLALARSGDRQALDLLLERHQAQIYRFGLKMCRDPEAAKDVLQDTLIAMARGVRSFRGAASLSTWLYTIARSFCIKHRKQALRSAQVATDEQPAPAAGGESGPSPDEAAIGKEVERALRRAIDGLEPTSREVLILRDMEGLTAAEVAAVLLISVDAVKSRLHRAREAVRTQVAPLLSASPSLQRPATTCPDITGLLSRYMEGEIGADACRTMQRHVDTCAQCASACAALRQSLEVCRTSTTTLQVPPDVQRAVRLAIQRVLLVEDSR